MIFGHVEVSFSCPACGLRDIHVAVPQRGDRDLREWSDDVAGICGRLHQTLRRDCKGVIDIRVPESEQLTTEPWTAFDQTPASVKDEPEEIV